MYQGETKDHNRSRKETGSASFRFTCDFPLITLDRNGYVVSFNREAALIGLHRRCPMKMDGSRDIGPAIFDHMGTGKRLELRMDVVGQGYILTPIGHNGELLTFMAQEEPPIDRIDLERLSKAMRTAVIRWAPDMSPSWGVGPVTDLLGVSLSSLQAGESHLYDRLSDEDCVRLTEFIDICREVPGFADRIELRTVGEGHDSRCLRMSAIGLSDPHGEVDGVFSMITDITDEARSDFLMAAHRNLGECMRISGSANTSLRLCLQEALAFLDKDVGSICLFNGGECKQLVSVGLDVNLWETLSPVCVQRIVSKITQGKSVTIACEERQSEDDLSLIHFEPLMIRGVVKGIVCIGSNHLEEIGQAHRETCSSICWLIGGEVGRMLADEELRQSEANLSMAAEMSHLGIWSWNRSNLIMNINENLAEILGVTNVSIRFDAKQSETAPWTWLDDEGRSALSSLLQPDGDQAKHEICIRKGGGDDAWLLASSSVLTRDSDGRPELVQGTVLDITEMRRKSEALRRANDRLSILSNVTRHDVMNKLSVIMGYDVMLLDMVEGDARSHVETIDAQVKTIRDIMQFTHDYQSVGNSKPKWLRVSDLCNEMVRLLDVGGVDLRIDTQDLEVYSDPMLAKVLFNLVENAIRHGGQVGLININHHCRGKDLIIVIEDDGCGIPADEKEIIFERGYGSNTGFGLFLSRMILSLTDLTIAEVGEPGHGAKFEITVPDGNHRLG